MTGTNGVPRLSVDGLCVEYGAVKAVTDVDFAVHPGQIVTIIGPNGAGKSSTLRGLAGLAPVTAGTGRLDGQHILGTAAHHRPGRGLVLVPEGRRMFGELSVLENLYLGAHTRSAAGIDEDLDRIYHLFPELAVRTKQAAGTLSGGQQQMLAIGRGLMARPRLLMLDEPSLGLAPKIVRTVMDQLRTLSEDGTSLLLVEQNARIALSVADHAYVMRTGRMVTDGPADELAATEDIRRRYFSVAEDGPPSATDGP